MVTKKKGKHNQGVAGRRTPLAKILHGKVNRWKPFRNGSPNANNCSNNNNNNKNWSDRNEREKIKANFSKWSSEVRRLTKLLRRRCVCVCACGLESWIIKKNELIEAESFRWKITTSLHKSSGFSSIDRRENQLLVSKNVFKNVQPLKKNITPHNPT